MRTWPRDCIVEGVRRVVILLLLCGCAESRFMVDETALDGVPVAEPQQQDPTPPVSWSGAYAPMVDTFWLQQAVAESTRPPPRPVHSISLGYIGDGPLTGGVMRGTPIPWGGPMQNPGYVEYTNNAPCACAQRGAPPPPE